MAMKPINEQKRENMETIEMENYIDTYGLTTHVVEKCNDSTGTHLQGYLKINYNTLVNIFGKPHWRYERNEDEYACNKTEAEWRFVIKPNELNSEEKYVFTIYNWKDGKNYLGKKDGLDIEDIEIWHIGGYNAKTYKLVRSLIEGYARKHRYVVTPPTTEVIQY
tara:strand:+ start:1616 stop:2107 length:492 start_codon:yes stop_codon:yes gene_type:complete